MQNVYSYMYASLFLNNWIYIVISCWNMNYMQSDKTLLLMIKRLHTLEHKGENAIWESFPFKANK